MKSTGLVTTVQSRVSGFLLAAGLVSIGCVGLTSPAQALFTVDLIYGNTGTANNTIYNINSQPGGALALDPFLSLDADTSEQGYNESVAGANPWDAISPTRDLLMSELVTVSIGGIDYYEFLLAIDQTPTSSSLSLANVQIFTRGTAIANATDDLSGLGTLRYNSDVGAQRDVTVDLREFGAVDLLMYVPKSLFAGASSADFVYFYSSFSGTYGSNGSAEQWGLACPQGGCSSVTPVPEPGTMALLGLGLLGLGVSRRRA